MLVLSAVRRGCDGRYNETGKCGRHSPATANVGRRVESERRRERTSRCWAASSVATAVLVVFYASMSVSSVRRDCGVLHRGPVCRPRATTDDGEAGNVCGDGEDDSLVRLRRRRCTCRATTTTTSAFSMPCPAQGCLCIPKQVCRLILSHLLTNDACPSHASRDASLLEITSSPYQ
jgi:hypothetical protein